MIPSIHRHFSHFSDSLLHCSELARVSLLALRKTSCVVIVAASPLPLVSDVTHLGWDLAGAGPRRSRTPPPTLARSVLPAPALAGARACSGKPSIIGTWSPTHWYWLHSHHSCTPFRCWRRFGRASQRRPLLPPSGASWVGAGHLDTGHTSPRYIRNAGVPLSRRPCPPLCFVTRPPH
jgi:hypothetical protein